MDHIFKHILIAVGLLVYGHRIHAQTLNPDTLVKYRVSKILTYKHDSTGNKQLELTRIINHQGLVSEKYMQIKATHHAISYIAILDTCRYRYDSNIRVVSYVNTTMSTTFFPLKSDEQKSTKQSTTLYRYKRVFFVAPWSNKKITFYYSKNKKTIIKSYSNGKHIKTYKSLIGIDYKIEKEKIHLTVIPAFSNHKNRHTHIKGRGRKYFWQRHARKTIFKTKSKLDSNGNSTQQTVIVKHYFHQPFKKPLKYSYETTYEYIYQGSLMTVCKQKNTNFIYIHMPKKTQIGNKSIGFEPGDLLPKETIYEYITNPE